MHMFHQRLADALGDAAMDLAMDDQRIDGAADIVDRGVVHELDGAGLRIDLDLADMAAIGKARLGDGLVAFGRERAAQIVRQIAALGRRARDVEQADRTVGAFHREAAGLELDVGRGRLQQMLGDARAPSR